MLLDIECTCKAYIADICKGLRRDNDIAWVHTPSSMSIILLVYVALNANTDPCSYKTSPSLTMINTRPTICSYLLSIIFFYKNEVKCWVRSNRKVKVVHICRVLLVFIIKNRQHQKLNIVFDKIVQGTYVQYCARNLQTKA